MTPFEIRNTTHMDIFHIQKEKFISVKQFSKFTKLFHIKDRGVLHVREKLIKILHYFTVPEVLVADNEKSFVSPIIVTFLKSLSVHLYLTPSQRSDVIGQIEKVHSTILEVYRCLSLDSTKLQKQNQMIFLFMVVGSIFPYSKL